MTCPGSHLQRLLGVAVGRRVRALRFARGVTQRELAESAGTHRPIIGRIERGVHVPDLYTFTELARALGVTARDFVAGIDWHPIDVAANATLRRTA